MMDWKWFVTVFGSVFLAEMADKTQLATMLFAADRPGGRLTVFIAASLALVATTGIAVLAGSVLSQYVQPRNVSLVAGCGFIAVGVWILWQGWFSA